ncbi:MAG: glycerol-3-phosphate 1-O-acyltransferase PlsY [Acidobacteria bacterium]|nr:glycerol-3-phosphate 1-O-acyltransferase PlsY [Acidobacteriota bacterium]
MTRDEILIAIFGYLLGAIPFGFIIAKLRSGEDIRKKGSGNIGATNVLRTQGAFYGFLTLFLDAAKAALPVYLARHFGAHPWFPAFAGGAAIVGHCYPVYLGFKGGKAAASGLGAFLFIAPVTTLIACASFIVVMLSFGYVSVGSMVGSFVFVCILWAFYFLKKSYDLYTCIIATLLALLLVYRHRSNIKNLFEGKEKKIWVKDENES